MARVNNDQPLFWLGSALPDWAAMGRFRLMGSTTEPSVEAGIRFHHATDSAFHAHPWFVATQRRLQQQLQSDGLGRGPARAIAHVGPELLLDGAIDHHDPTTAALDALAGASGDLLDLVTEEHRANWSSHLDRLTSGSMPTDYDNPTAVASRLFRILARRPRLAFPSDDVAVVACRLADAQPDIVDIAGPLVAELADQLR